ncbi:toll/interleukin-1 receptor domain-containing protein [Umezawaea sp. Da 62-37]|uniref:toll/interleukin-1 receptor domain-containing protein n=1 Tax=Umezawaea sp. Da 62-37 TaxID=3075927 RepID=UPI0028F6F454|nr:toll/interleukin-1 receptor domain-containing protein [Umezawaea sp. Da 62-37]WNV85326.1 toll/interleukin-1 receptor domain-containing protein [Umezawaea sp. Da 62-37]
MAGVFVNYRVNETSYVAAGITGVLIDNFTADLVFRDAVSMKAGEHYPSTIRAALHDADVLVAVVGPEWMQEDPGTGRPRIEGERDWVRLEIAYALENGIPVVPVLLQDTRSPRHAELPESIRAFASLQAERLNHRQWADDTARLVQRLVNLVPSLVVPRLFVQPPAEPDPNASPSTLLRPEQRVVPFSGRERELADLTAWATDSAANSTRLVVGAAGSGRKRLALELCHRLANAGWLAGVVDGEAPAAQIRRTSAIDKPLLAVVDDAELRSHQLLALAEAVSARTATLDAPSRLLILGRSDGAWLRPLREHADERVAALFRPTGRAGTMTVEPLTPHTSFASAVEAFADALGVTADVPSPPETNATTLEVHALALCTALAQGGFGPPEDTDDPLVALRGYDLAQWRRRISAEGGAEDDLAALAVIGTFATLCVPTSADQAEALATRLPDILAQAPMDVRRHVERWSRLHPGPHQLSALSPAPLGAVLIADTLADHPWIIPVLVGSSFPDDWLATALTTLGRALPDHPRLREHVTSLFHANPRRVEPFVSAVIGRLEDPEPFARAVAAEMGKLDWQIPDLVSIMGKISVDEGGHDAIRGAMMDAFLGAAKKFTAQAQAHGDIKTPPGMEPFQKVVDNLTTLFQDFVVGALDPKSGRTPTVDGKPIVPEGPMTVLRDLYFGHQREKRKEKEQD